MHWMSFGFGALAGAMVVLPLAGALAGAAQADRTNEAFHAGYNYRREIERAMRGDGVLRIVPDEDEEAERMVAMSEFQGPHAA